MGLVVYNTMSRRKEPFQPRDEGKVSMYVCGPTVYNYIHIGNARAYLVFDIVRRYLAFKGYEVEYVQNFTDIDDKIINRADQEGKTPAEVASLYEEAFLEDMESLNIRPPTIMPRATETIPDMIEIIEGLVSKGYAYASEGDVYFSVAKFKDYGKLSGRSPDELNEVGRVEASGLKRNPMDFALWKASKPGEPSWDSPWGPGRPAWHIECSAMSLKYLGMGFDIHGGGQDLIFPHHENEIAQSEVFTGERPFVRYWMHNGFVNIMEEKMSKSLGNIILIRDIITRYPPDVVRMLVLQTHYRTSIDFGPDALDESQRAYERIENCVFGLEGLLANITSKVAPVRTEREIALIDFFFDAERRFEEAMDDDFNTARAIGVIFELVKELNTFVDEQQILQSPGGPIVANQGMDLLLKLCRILGLLEPAAAECEETAAEWEEDHIPSPDVLIDLLLEVRTLARSKGEWQTADLIRSRLHDLGVRIDDLREGVRWKFT
ncbi:MAG: cysteine--tRNA ligase [Candidatus Solincola sediminis]|uniref:Cysteine--tRNA ligase n=1 Tax=Candidatus Solincola sediminis TaxID=1797199 RepID=A0A1F2WF91_9ACTN|nr:MAG: cysteine--tRNA ligase [Candidatus Solincola sediminis]OFW57800.1 MAG: cysteine--tRNA ligase [Candidatus Solincola sediminis]